MLGNMSVNGLPWVVAGTIYLLIGL